MSRERRTLRLFRLGGWALFFFVLALWSGLRLWHRESPLLHRPAPPFSAAIVAGDGAGDRVSLQGLRGHPVMLDFWASWCPPCRASIPILTRLARRHEPAGLVALGVNVEVERPRSFVARAHAALGAGFPTVHDEGLRMQAAYGVTTLPTLVLIDRRGIVRRLDVGVPSETALDAEIRRLLEEPP